MPSLRIAFAGTPAFAATHLQTLLTSAHQVIAVYTQPDRPAGRGKQLHASPVKALATQYDTPVLQPLSLKDPIEQSRLNNLQPDVMIVVAYGLLLPPAILSVPRYGCLNVHASLLPRWRGAAPIERAILAGDAETGITIMQMDAGLDTGAMLHKTSVKIAARDNRQMLEEKLAQVGTKSLIYVLDNLESLRSRAQPQDNAKATYAAKLVKEEAKIDWRQTAENIDRQIRAGFGRLPAYTTVEDLRIQILQATPDQKQTGGTPGTIISTVNGALQIACGKGSLAVTQVQLAGKNPVSVSALLNSPREEFLPGRIFCSTDVSQE
ncbi:MAG: methionyl-tRNA formyltransferase [Pseudohongiellaceae bacterium]